MRESIFDGPIGKMLIDSLDEKSLAETTLETWQAYINSGSEKSLEDIKEACISTIKAINLKLGIENEQF